MSSEKELEECDGKRDMLNVSGKGHVECDGKRNLLNVIGKET